MSPAASRGRDSPGFLLQVIQAFITGYLSHLIGRRAASTGSSFLEDSGHAHLDPTPEEDLEDELDHDGYGDLPAKRSP